MKSIYDIHLKLDKLVIKNIIVFINNIPDDVWAKNTKNIKNRDMLINRLNSNSKACYNTLTWYAY